MKVKSASTIDAATVAWSYWQAMNDGRIEDALAMLGSDATWWSSLTGDVPAAKMADVIRLVYDQVPLRFTLRGMYTGTHGAALELSGHGVFDDGSVYDNDYCVIMTVEDGVITAVREHANTLQATQALLPRLPEAAITRLMG